MYSPAFHIVHQPILHLATRRVVGYEALLRAGDLSPTAAFRRARAEGSEVEFDLICVARAVASAWRLSREERLFINLRPATVVALARGEAQLNIPATAPSLVFELPEAQGWPEGDALEWDLLRAALIRHGETALDDLGEGFQDIQRLRLLRPDWIKLGRSLISQLNQDPEGRVIVKHLCMLAQDLGCCVVAEGIETTQELETCLQLGVEFGQGFLFGRQAEVGTRDCATRHT